MLDYIFILIIIGISLVTLLFLYLLFKFFYKLFAINRTKIHGSLLPVFYLPPRRNVPMEVFDNSKLKITKREKRAFNLKKTIENLRKTISIKNFHPIIHDPEKELENTIKVKVRNKVEKTSEREENLKTDTLDEIESGQIQKQAEIVQNEYKNDLKEEESCISFKQTESEKYNLSDKMLISTKSSPFEPESSTKMKKSISRNSLIHYFLSPSFTTSSFFSRNNSEKKEATDNPIESDSEKSKQRRKSSFRRKKKLKTIRSLKSNSNYDDEDEDYEMNEEDEAPLHSHSLTVFNLDSTLNNNKNDLINRLKSKRNEENKHEKHVHNNAGPLPEDIPEGFQAIYVPSFSDEYLIYKRILYRFHTKSIKGWYIGTIVARSKKEDCNYKIKYDRKETKTVFVDGVRNVQINLSGDYGYGRKWILLEPASPPPNAPVGIVSHF